ncbi:MAG: hypothetical protein WED07_16440 [Candidatus Freyarchaeum deiterrae]
MKRKAAIIIVLILIALLPLAAIIMTYNNPLLFTNTSYPSSNPIAKSPSGIGGQIPTILNQTNNTASPNTINDTTTGFNIPCPQNWNITYANITLEDITAPNCTIISTNTASNDSWQISLTSTAMSFQITNPTAYLDSAILNLTILFSGTANLRVYNAQNNGTGFPIPNLQRGPAVLNVSLTTGTYLKDIPFSHILLNDSDTFNHTFFITIERNGAGDLLNGNWNAVGNPSGGYTPKGYAWWNGPTWTATGHPLDLTLNVSVSASNQTNPQSVYPTDISLNINGTSVSNTSNVGEGMYTMYLNITPSSGFIFFNVTTTWMSTVTYNVTFWNVTYGKNINATTNYQVDTTSVANWTVTVDVSTGSGNGFPANSTIVHNYVNVTIPFDWQNATSYAFNVTQSNYISFPRPLVFEATNGTWTLQCNAPNYITNISVMNQGHNVTNIGAIVPDNLTINIALNTTISNSWNANLSIYNSTPLLRFTNATSGTTTSSFWFPLDVQKNITSFGNYNFTVFFNSSVEVGYREIGSFQVNNSALTSLTVLSHDSYADFNQLANITVGFNRTDINEGIAGIALANFSVSGSAHINSSVENGSGVYTLRVTFPSNSSYTVNVTVDGGVYFGNPTSGGITILYGVPPPAPSNSLAALLLGASQSGPNMGSMLLVIGLVGAVVAVVAVGFVAGKRRGIPSAALSSLENIIVDHIPTGATLWAFDFIKMEQDVTLVSGFMSAVKSFMGEMMKGGLRKLETEFGTFIREDSVLLTITCITGGNTPAEENWIRQKLRDFVSTAEQQHFETLEKWNGDVAPFRKSFPTILASVIDLEKAEELHKQRILKLENEKAKLQGELNNLGSQLETLNKQFEAKEISKAEFEAGTAEIDPEYDMVQKEYIRVSLFLSRVPPTTKAKKVKPEATEDVEKIQENFLKLRMEIEELRRKELEGKITEKDHKRRDKLQSELVSLIEKLEKLKK